MFKSQMEIDENGPKWVQNGSQVLRIDPQACRGHFLTSGAGPAAQVDPKSAPSRPRTPVG